MKLFSKNRSSLSVAVLLAAGSLVNFAQATGQGESSSAVALSESDSGDSSCVMVFARVGERFRYELPAASGQAVEKCVVGKNADGEVSSLPRGLVFNAKEASLEGVPLRAGFHEFVVVSTEAGEPREQVVLIDIQGHAFAGGGVDYASYVANGLH
ncbi:hypothetical protein IEN85_04250 [Pelagicoccus sp. NFK12]|uniref:Uncharacterized protein n=1 Tax=Pelagicoccus enzymogenes TaxID=2773457 RepID=A0A927F641_9BACT|nr:hypothetical protein [Pelagicoccus enzymogenes]MBD5778690.1 hypothetical protein [Pelagicoccus enzymogenes]